MKKLRTKISEKSIICVILRSGATKSLVFQLKNKNKILRFAQNDNRQSIFQISLAILFTLCLSSFVFAQSSTDLTGIKICIDPGHGGHNAANDRNVVPETGSDFWESESNFQKALLLRPMLQARGATVYLTRQTNDYPNDADEPSLSARVTFANGHNVNWFHSIHSNATGGNNTSTNYTLVLLREDIATRQSVSPQAVEMSSYIYNNIRAKDRTNSSGGNIPGYPGVYKDYTFYGGAMRLGVLSGLNMPGELSEGSFHDYFPETRRLLNNSYRKGEAYGIYNAFLEYFHAPFDTLGIICGTQKDGTTPINNIVVRLLPVNKVYKGDAYNNGYFLFDSLAPGNYQVLFETPGYAQDTAYVTLLALVKTVDSSIPVNNAINVSRSQSIVINFLAPVDTTNVKAAFSIFPNTAGTVTFNPGRTVLTFTPNFPLLYLADYTVTLTGFGETRQPTVFVDNKMVTSNVTTANFGFTFQTEQLPPSVILTQPKQNDTAFVVTKQIGLKFSLSMDTASVRASLSIVPNVEKIFSWTQNNTTLLITPTGGLPYNTNYTVTVGSGTKSIYGLAIDANKDSIPGDPYVLTFKTQMNPASVNEDIITPISYSLRQNYPNPFNPTTSIEFSIPVSGLVSLKVYDVMGREIANLVNAKLSIGRYSITFDAVKIPSGVYFYRLETEKFISVKRMMVLK